MSKESIYISIPIIDHDEDAQRTKAGQNSKMFHSLEIYVLQNEIFIEIDDNMGNENACITFDKSTAIKLSKEIRRQISLLNDVEV